MVNVKISEDDLVDLLIERLKHWTQDEDVIDLYEDMYYSYCDSGCFDGMELDIMVVVDNDWVNYCEVIDETDEHWDKLVELWDNGDRDVSCEDVEYSFIEAYNPRKKLMLVRW